MENEPEIKEGSPDHEPSGEVQNPISNEPTETDLEVAESLKEISEKDTEMAETLKEISETIQEQNEQALSLEETQKQYESTQQYYESSEEYQDQVLRKLFDIQNEIESGNTTLFEKMDTLIEIVSNPTISDNVAGTYGLIAIPIIVVIFILYKLISMWVKPFI